MRGKHPINMIKRPELAVGSKSPVFCCRAGWSDRENGMFFDFVVLTTEMFFDFT